MQEANLAKILSESERVFDALQKSFSGNQRNGHVAIQLARLMEELQGLKRQLQDATELRRLDANRTNTRLHSAYGEFLLRNNFGANVDREYHFRLGYTQRATIITRPNFSHGRQLFIMGNFDASEGGLQAIEPSNAPSRY